MKKLIVASLVLGMAVAAVADIMLGFDLAGTTAEPWPAATVAANLSTGSGTNELIRVGLGTAASANAYGSNGWNLTDVFDNSGDYVSFTLAPAAGFQLTLTDISWSRVNGSNTAPGNGRWGYSIGGGAWTYETDFALTYANASGSWDFTDISGTTLPVEFRFWAWGATSISGGVSATSGSVSFRNSVAGDDIILNGSIVAIPEPGVLTLMSLGGLVAVLRFARRRVA